MKRAVGFFLVLICVDTLPAQQFSVQDLPQLRGYESERAGSWDRSGGNADYTHIPPGQTLALLDQDGPGEIRHIWITLASPEVYHLKKMVLRMYWDDEKDPSVETPLGDFFGLGLGDYQVFQSALITVNPEKALNSYFPMPFAKHGRITVTNEGSQDSSDFYWNIDWVKLSSLAPHTAYFHAQYRQCTPCKGWYQGNFYGNDFREAHSDPRWYNKSGDPNYVFLDTQGDGQLVGITLSVFENQWGGWNEGDEFVWIDGEPDT